LILEPDLAGKRFFFSIPDGSVDEKEKPL